MKLKLSGYPFHKRKEIEQILNNYCDHICSNKFSLDENKYFMSHCKTFLK